jgi:hypothetical protein
MTSVNDDDDNSQQQEQVCPNQGSKTLSVQRVAGPGAVCDLTVYTGPSLPFRIQPPHWTDLDTSPVSQLAPLSTYTSLDDAPAPVPLSSAAEFLMKRFNCYQRTQGLRYNLIT